MMECMRHIAKGQNVKETVTENTKTCTCKEKCQGNCSCKKETK